MSEYKELSSQPWTNIELLHDNIREWIVALIVLDKDSPYSGGYFKANMTFPQDYPYRPPDFRFLRPLYHPNIYPDGRLCISILHQPGEDEMSGESADERWSPAQNVESVLLSILSLLDNAEVSSPANVDAAVMLRNEPEKYKRKVKDDLDQSKKDIPEGFTMPNSDNAFKAGKKEDEYVMNWEDSDADEDFGASDSEVEFGDTDSEDMDVDETTMTENEEDDSEEDEEVRVH